MPARREPVPQAILRSTQVDVGHAERTKAELDGPAAQLVDPLPIDLRPISRRVCRITHLTVLDRSN
jgi:hypothetical protein